MASILAYAILSFVFAVLALARPVPGDEYSLIQKQHQLNTRGGVSFSQLHERGAVHSALKLDHQRQIFSQPSDVTVTSSHENFFQRMGNAFMAVIVGIIMMYFSVPVLWLNEKRAAKFEALIDKGEADCRSISADDFSEKNTDWLVHATGDTKSVRPVKDPQFNVSYDSGVIRLSSNVEIYQWIEEEKSETKEKETLGGGKTTETRKWKEYRKSWSSAYVESERFEKKQWQGENTQNSRPAGIEFGSNSKTCERVEFGKGFLLGSAEISQLTGGDPLSTDKLVCEKNANLTFSKAEGGFYYSGKGTILSPGIGDVRVTFTVLKDLAITVVALQSQDKEGRGCFLPYRVIRLSPCPCYKLTEDQEKERLHDEALKTPQEINEENMWGGMFWCCCCGCNLVQWCCGVMMMPELRHAWGQTLTKSQAFKQIKNSAAMMKWVVRLVGWLLMFFGLYMTFTPFTTFLKILPFGIGTFLSSVGSAIVGLFSFMVTLIIATLIVAAAYSMYHPMVGLMAFAFAGAIVAGILCISNVAKP